jgi:hypothetical protein
VRGRKESVSVGQPLAVDRPAQSLPHDFLIAAESLCRHPRFRLALARYCRQMATESPVAWPVYKLFDQLHRYVVSYMLIHNYYAWQRGKGPSPTLAVLQKVAGSSPRQTAGFVAAMKVGKFVIGEVDPTDRRVKRLKPAPAMVDEIGRSVRLFVQAVDEIEERLPARSIGLNDPDRLGELLRRSAAFVLRNGTLIHSFPRVLHFAGRDCGYLLLAAVIGAHYADVVPGAPDAMPLSLRALARRFQVSRSPCRQSSRRSQAARLVCDRQRQPAGLAQRRPARRVRAVGELADDPLQRGDSPVPIMKDRPCPLPARRHRLAAALVCSLRCDRDKLPRAPAA